MITRRSAVLGIILMGSMLHAGCERRTSAPAPATPTTPAKPAIGVTLLTLQDGFYQELRAGLQAEADKLGYELIIAAAEKDAARQANQIDDLIVKKVKAIVVSPCDSRSVGASIKAANDAGIPVVTADIASLSPLGRVESHIASDNLAGGRKAAELMAAALQGKGKVAILSHPEVTSVQDRVKGFREGLVAHPGIQIVGDLPTEGRRDKALRAAEDLLQSHPDLAGIFGINDDTALGALAAVQAGGRVGAIRIIGYDGTPEARAKIEDGSMHGSVIQNPRLIGELTIRTLHDVLAGKTPPAVVPVEVGSVTKGS